MSVSGIDRVGRSQLVTLDKPSVTPAAPFVHAGSKVIITDGSLVRRDRPSVSAVQIVVAGVRRSLNLDAASENPDLELVFGVSPLVDRAAQCEIAVAPSVADDENLVTPSRDSRLGPRHDVGRSSLWVASDSPRVARCSGVVHRVSGRRYPHPERVIASRRADNGSPNPSSLDKPFLPRACQSVGRSRRVVTGDEAAVAEFSLAEPTAGPVVGLRTICSTTCAPKQPKSARFACLAQRARACVTKGQSRSRVLCAAVIAARPSSAVGSGPASG